MSADEDNERPEGLGKLEHDHGALSRQVQELRAMVDRHEKDGASLGEEFLARLMDTADALFEHFAREEEGLFPYIIEQLPPRRAAIEEMQAAHDRICGAASRILSLAERGPFPGQLPLAVQLFRRFDAEYTDHARREAEVLRALGGELSGAQIAALADVLRGT